MYTVSIVKKVCLILSLEPGNTADFMPVPSRSRIYQALLVELETTKNADLTSELTIPSFLNEAILISEEQ